MRDATKLLIAACVLLAMPMPGRAQSGHPMDALTGNEVERAVALIRKAGHGDDTSRFPTITLKEMDKADVLAWKPGDPVSRAAFVVMRHGGATHEIEVDLTADAITSMARVDGEPGVILDEWLEARRATMEDERWRAAMARRGITDFERVFCSPLTAGHFPGGEHQGRRIMNVPCYIDDPESSHLYGRPVDGLYTVVDVESGEVLDVIDLGVVDAAPAPRRAQWSRAPMKPVIISSPQGINFEVNGAIEVRWGPWRFHMRMEKRVGPVISLVRYDDDGRERLIAYQMSLSEMFVPYMSPDIDWSYRTYLDTGEFGAGALISSLVPGSDCPEQAAYVASSLPNDKGQAYQVRRSICLFERATGDPAWRHGRPAQPTGLTRPDVELVVRTIPTIGNYDYIIDWVFQQSGNIEIRVGAAGIIAARNTAAAGMDAPGAATETAFGELVAPGTVAIYHDHFFNFRLDLDVDGPMNTMIRDRLVPQRLPDANPRRSLWTVSRVPVSREGPLSADGHDGLWRLVNPNEKTPLGHHPGIEIMPGHQIVSALAPDDPPQARAAFSAETLWLTRYKPRELFAAGDYPNLSRGGDGLPAYAGDGEAAENSDLVVWLNVAIHHVTRVEDWPIMPVRWHGFTLRPFNFFAENPAYGIPPGFARPEPPALRSTIDSGGGQ
jgi:primary-amine oxidase